MSDRKLHIATHPLTSRILQGRAKNKDGRVLLSQTTDVTNDVLLAVIQKTKQHGGAFDIHSTGGEAYTLSVVRKEPGAKVEPTPVPMNRDGLAELIAQHLGGTFHCHRVWSAWGVGTMSENDFSDVAESDTPGELADAIIAAQPLAAHVLSDQEAALLEQAASMLEALGNDERNRGNCSASEGAISSAHAVRRLAVALAMGGAQNG